MNNNIYVHKKSNIYNKSKKDVRNIFTEYIKLVIVL